MYAAHDWFTLGIAAAALAAIYQYLAARSLLEYSSRDAFQYAAGEVALQSLFFSVLAQVWVRRWDWYLFPAIRDAAMGLSVFALILALVLLINGIFGRKFLEVCNRRARLCIREFSYSGKHSFRQVTVLTVIWLLIWQTYCLTLEGNDSSPIEAFRDMLGRLNTWETWEHIITSLSEIFGGLFVGGLLALSVSAVLHRSGSYQAAIAKILSATYLSPIALWLLVFDFVNIPGVNSAWFWYQTSFLGVGHKMVAVGFLTFYFFSRALWTFRDTPLLQRWLIAIDDALPIAFVAMLFSELYSATAGLGFQMIVAGATYKFQEGLAWFLFTVILLSALSMILRLIVRFLGFRAVPSETAEGQIPAN